MLELVFPVCQSHYPAPSEMEYTAQGKDMVRSSDLPGRNHREWEESIRLKLPRFISLSVHENGNHNTYCIPRTQEGEMHTHQDVFSHLATNILHTCLFSFWCPRPLENLLLECPEIYMHISLSKSTLMPVAIQSLKSILF